MKKVRLAVLLTFDQGQSPLGFFKLTMRARQFSLLSKSTSNKNKRRKERREKQQLKLERRAISMVLDDDNFVYLFFRQHLCCINLSALLRFREMQFAFIRHLSGAIYCFLLFIPFVWDIHLTTFGVYPIAGETSLGSCIYTHHI